MVKQASLYAVPFLLISAFGKACDRYAFQVSAWPQIHRPWQRLSRSGRRQCSLLLPISHSRCTQTTDSAPFNVWLSEVTWQVKRGLWLRAKGGTRVNGPSVEHGLIDLQQSRPVRQEPRLHALHLTKQLILHTRYDLQSRQGGKNS